MTPCTADNAWRDRLMSLLVDHEYSSSPRGMPVFEQLHRTIIVDIERSLITHPLRKLNYRFAAAEALWIMNGDDRVEPLARYNKRMRDFSDDGVVLAGAYGPRLQHQVNYVIDALRRDRDTRQAVASIWTPSPGRSKDIPCTLSLSFMIRNDALHAHAFMRSSDVWLGVPYDLFSFSCFASMIAALYNDCAGVVPVGLGRLHLTAASSHIYAEHREQAAAIVTAAPSERAFAWPVDAVRNGEPGRIAEYLTDMIDSGPPELPRTTLQGLDAG